MQIYQVLNVNNLVYLTIKISSFALNFISLLIEKYITT